MDSRWLIDGRAAPDLPADDRGLAYGDGVFRTLRLRSGRIEAWPLHLTRLRDDCARLTLELSADNTLVSDMQRLIDETGVRDAVLKILITRGSGGRGYTPPETPVSRRLVSIHALPDHAHVEPRPLTLGWSPVELARQPLLAGIKHLNRLEQVLARADCQRRGVADVVMRDSDGWLIATTMRNLMFRTVDGHWHTPTLDQAGVRGVTRERLSLALAAAGTLVAESGIAGADLPCYDVALACNSIAGVAAITRIGHIEFSKSDEAARGCRRLLQDDRA